MMEIILVVGSLLLPSLLYVAGRIAGRDVWGLVLSRYEKRGGSAYRAAEVPIWVPGKTPWSVKLAALTSFLLGQMVIPGALAALVGVVISVEMLGRSLEAWSPPSSSSRSRRRVASMWRGRSLALASSCFAAARMLPRGLAGSAAGRLFTTSF